jgi:predicted  nucleic acid-binding Zn ribbon protein
MLKEGWCCCPQCGQKLFPVNRKTKIEFLEFRCKRCRQVSEIKIEPEPEPKPEPEP